jgi:hypothetical protein
MEDGRREVTEKCTGIKQAEGGSPPVFFFSVQLYRYSVYRSTRYTLGISLVPSTSMSTTPPSSASLNLGIMAELDGHYLSSVLAIMMVHNNKRVRSIS